MHLQKNCTISLHRSILLHHSDKTNFKTLFIQPHHQSKLISSSLIYAYQIRKKLTLLICLHHQTNAWNHESDLAVKIYFIKMASKSFTFRLNAFFLETNFDRDRTFNSLYSNMKNGKNV